MLIARINRLGKADIGARIVRGLHVQLEYATSSAANAQLVLQRVHGRLVRPTRMVVGRLEPEGDALRTIQHDRTVHGRKEHAVRLEFHFFRIDRHTLVALDANLLARLDVQILIDRRANCSTQREREMIVVMGRSLLVIIG